MKRVGFDAHVLTGKHQGSRTFLENLLREIGHIDRQNEYVIYSYDPAVTSRLFPHPNFFHRRIAVTHAVPRLVLYWEWVRRRDRLDVLVTQYIGPPMYRGVQFVVIHDVLFESHPALFPAAMRWRLKVWTRFSARRAARVFTVSRFTKQELIARYGVLDERIRITPNGFTSPREPSLEANAIATALRPYVLCVGRLEPRKNIELAIAATESLRRAGTRLVIVGREDRTPASLRASIAAGPGIVHLQDVSDEQLAALYRGAGALLFPSAAEGFGLPVLEALGHGIPVVASNRTAIPEVGGPFALYFDPEAPDAVTTMERLIVTALRDPPSHDEQTLRAHLATFDWRGSARTLVEDIERL